MKPRSCSLRVSLTASLLMVALAAVASPVRFGRLKYSGGGDWYADPSALPNLIHAVQQRTTIDVAPKEEVVTLDDDRIFDCAIVFVTGHGRISFTPDEAARLRRYLLGGGFLHVDDNYGLDQFFRPAIKAVFPDRPLVELPFNHPIYHCFYQFPHGLPKIHKHHGGPPHGYGILNGNRVMLFYSYNTDINNGWENFDVYHDPPAKHEAALRMGINIVTYALTH